MPPPAVEPQPPRPPFQAGPGRRLYHLLVSIAGWALFVYWWVVVIVGRASRQQITFTVLFIASTLVLCVLITSLWTLHNLGISRRKRGRWLVPAVREDFSTDSLGHPIRFEGGLEAARDDPVVQIRLENGRKHYRPSSTVRNRSQADGAKAGTVTLLRRGTQG